MVFLLQIMKFCIKDSFSGDQLVSVADRLGYPLVIKDPLGGSSLGIGIAANLEEAGTICSSLFNNRKSFYAKSLLKVERLVAVTLRAKSLCLRQNCV